MRRVLAVLLIGGLVVAVAGCRESTMGPAVDDAAKPYVDALSKRLEGRQLPPILTPDQERCVASSIVDGIGVEALHAAGGAPGSIVETSLRNLGNKLGTPERGETIAKGIVDCGVGGKFAGLFASRELADPRDDVQVQKVIDCVGTELDDNESEALIAAYFFGHPDAADVEEVRSMLTDCGFSLR